MDLAAVGPVLEHDPRFPNRVNVEFVTVVEPDTLAMRVWERGVGETQSCGTGACAAAAVAHRRGLVGRERRRCRFPGDARRSSWPRPSASADRSCTSSTSRSISNGCGHESTTSGSRAASAHRHRGRSRCRPPARAARRHGIRVGDRGSGRGEPRRARPPGRHRRGRAGGDRAAAARPAGSRPVRGEGQGRRSSGSSPRRSTSTSSSSTTSSRPRSSATSSSCSSATSWTASR